MNNEGYADPTADNAVRRVKRERTKSRLTYRISELKSFQEAVERLKKAKAYKRIRWHRKSRRGHSTAFQDGLMQARAL